MASKKRKLKSGNYYHLYNRGNRKRAIVGDNIDKDFLLKKLKISFQKHPTEQLCAYALMNNHYHLLVKVTFPQEIPKIMREWGSSISQYINYRYDLVGRLFQSRYQSKMIVPGYHLTYLSRYIHRNPLHLPEVRSQTDLIHYKWSSLNEIFSEESNTPLVSSHYMGYFENKLDYLKYVLCRYNKKSYRYIASNDVLEEIFNPIVHLPRGYSSSSANQSINSLAT